MSFRLGLLMLAGAVAASTAVGTLHVQIKEYEVPTRSRGRMIRRSLRMVRCGTRGSEKFVEGHRAVSPTESIWIPVTMT